MKKPKRLLKPLVRVRGTVVNIEEKTKTEKAPLPYDLTGDPTRSQPTLWLFCKENVRTSFKAYTKRT